MYKTISAEIINYRFWKKVDAFRDNKCWNWLGAKTPKGYGKIFRDGHFYYAHRISYEMFREVIPTGLQIDHICNNKGCVNPNHLEVTTGKKNVLRGNTVSGNNSRKTHCPSGHEYDKKNTYVSKKGSRMCKTCVMLRGRIYRKNKRRTL